MTNKISACCFDLGNTLNNDILLTRKSVDRMGEWMESEGFIDKARRFAEAYHQANRNTDGPFYSHTYGEIEFFAKTFQALSITAISPEDALRVYRGFVDTYTPLDAKVPEALAYLSSLGIKSAILSNERIGRVDAYLEKTGLRPFFDAIVVSEACGFEKPDPEFFREALRQLGIPGDKAGTVVLFGDNTIADGACRDEGMIFVLVTIYSDRLWYFEKGDEHVPDFEIERVSMETIRSFLQTRD